MHVVIHTMAKAIMIYNYDSLQNAILDEGLESRLFLNSFVFLKHDWRRV